MSGCSSKGGHDGDDREGSSVLSLLLRTNGDAVASPLIFLFAAGDCVSLEYESRFLSRARTPLHSFNSQ